MLISFVHILLNNNRIEVLFEQNSTVRSLLENAAKLFNIDANKYCLKHKSLVLNNSLLITNVIFTSHVILELSELPMTIAPANITLILSSDLARSSNLSTIEGSFTADSSLKDMIELFMSKNIFIDNILISNTKITIPELSDKTVLSADYSTTTFHSLNLAG